jgi:hypothetical protein
MSAEAIDGQAQAFGDGCTCHGLFDSHMRTRKVLPKFPTASGAFVCSTTVDLDQNFGLTAYQTVYGLVGVIYGLLYILYWPQCAKYLLLDVVRWA